VLLQLDCCGPMTGDCDKDEYKHVLEACGEECRTRAVKIMLPVVRAYVYILHILWSRVETGKVNCTTGQLLFLFGVASVTTLVTAVERDIYKP